jgi:membrane-bound lytic murein transglycosylase C
MSMLGRWQWWLLLLVFYVFPANASHKPGEAHPVVSKAEKSLTDSQYARQKQHIAKAYTEYKKKVSRVWGNDTLVPDAKRDVRYRDKLRQRSIVDYEAGLVKVELAINAKHSEDERAVVDRLELAIEQTLVQGVDYRSIAEIARDPEISDEQAPPLLAGLVANADGLPFTPSELEDFKREHARKMEVRSLTGGDGQERTIVSARFEMVPDHLRVRVERFRDSVEHYAKKHNIPAHLVYAIIETESAFNPWARSPIPAFGLMQLVPNRAARDAFKFLYAEDRVVKERHLYVPDKNVELGTAYLHILYYHYFKSVKDPLSRQWATIAAYNAGARNVIKALVGRYTRKRYASSYSWKQHAFNKINSMGPKQVYRYFRKHMPAGETRRYIKKVRSRMNKYRS